MGLICPLPEQQLLPLCCTAGDDSVVDNFDTRALRWSMIVRDDEPNAIFSEIGDDATGALVMTSAAGASPGWSASAVDGQPAATFLGGPIQSFFGEQETDWGFCHQFPVSGEWYGNTTAGLNNQSVMRTRTNVAGPGFHLIWNGGAFRWDLVIYDGAGVALVTLQAPGVPAGPTHIAWTVSSFDAATGPRGTTPRARLYVNGVLAVTQAGLAANGSRAAPLVALTQGSPSVGLNAFTAGATRYAALWSRERSEAEILSSYARRKLIVSMREVITDWLMGDSTTLGAQTFRRWMDYRTRRTPNLFKLATGTVLAGTNFPGYDPNNDGVNGNTIAQMLARVNAPLFRPPKRIITLCGTNNLGAGANVPDVVAQAQNLIRAQRSRYQDIPAYLITVARGTGGATPFNANVDAYNAAMRGGGAAACGAGLLDMYSPVAAYPYNDATCPADAVGHQTPIGGVIMGNNVCDQLGIGGD